MAPYFRIKEILNNKKATCFRNNLSILLIDNFPLTKNTKHKKCSKAGHGILTQKAVYKMLIKLLEKVDSG